MQAANLPYETKAYVCTHVFDRSRPVLYVTRPDGDWCLLCGAAHPEEGSEYRVVGLGHIVDQDASLAEVLDLKVNEEAERGAMELTWTRSRF